MQGTRTLHPLVDISAALHPPVDISAPLHPPVDISAALHSSSTLSTTYTSSVVLLSKFTLSNHTIVRLSQPRGVSHSRNTLHTLTPIPSTHSSHHPLHTHPTTISTLTLPPPPHSPYHPQHTHPRQCLLLMEVLLGFNSGLPCGEHHKRTPCKPNNTMCIAT